MKEENSKLFVGNLSYDVTGDQLFELFNAVEGVEVSDAKVITDRETGRPRGFAFVTLAKPEMNEIAIQALNAKEVDGRVIIVNVARPQGSNDRDNRGGGYQGGNRNSGRSFGRRY